MHRLILGLLAALFLMPAISTAQRRVIVVMVDGYRWQELFRGADSTLINNGELGNVGMMKADYWRTTQEERRKALMPFTWNYIANNGTIIGNRE